MWAEMDEGSLYGTDHVASVTRKHVTRKHVAGRTHCRGDARLQMPWALESGTAKGLSEVRDMSKNMFLCSPCVGEMTSHGPHSREKIYNRISKTKTKPTKVVLFFKNISIKI